MKRRDALKSLGALAGAAAVPGVFSGCGGGGGGDGEVGITTIVSVMMENRSFDHYFGSRKLLEGGTSNGLTAGMANMAGGSSIEIYPEQDLTAEQDPPHSWDATHAQWNQGAMDGFMSTHRARYGAGSPNFPMGYLSREDLPWFYALADQGTLCDAWYSSLLTGTWPNRMYWHSATSNGVQVNELPGGGGLPWRSVHHSLSDAGVDWGYYYNDLPFVPLFRGVDTSKIKRFEKFFDDARNGTLPPVVYIDPAFGANDDHPPHHPVLGQQFLSSIFAALAASPQWKNCMLLITYDEHGGFFDHAAPPTIADDRPAAFGQLGVRVPTVVAGPYVKQGHVSSVVREHSSLIAHINGMFGLEPLTARDAGTNDLSEVIDMERLAAGDPAPPPELPAVEVNESMLRGAVHNRRSEPVELEQLADTGYFSPQHDRRAHVLDSLYEIGDALERLNAGRIVRGK